MTVLPGPAQHVEKPLLLRGESLHYVSDGALGSHIYRWGGREAKPAPVQLTQPHRRKRRNLGSDT